MGIEWVEAGFHSRNYRQLKRVNPFMPVAAKKKPDEFRDQSFEMDHL